MAKRRNLRWRSWQQHFESHGTKEDGNKKITCEREGH